MIVQPPAHRYGTRSKAVFASSPMCMDSATELAMPSRRRETLTPATNHGAASKHAPSPPYSSSSLSRPQCAPSAPQFDSIPTLDAPVAFCDSSDSWSPSLTSRSEAAAKESIRDGGALRAELEGRTESSFVQLVTDLVGEPSEDLADIVLPANWGEEASLRDFLKEMEEAEIIPSRRWTVVHGGQPIPGTQRTRQRPDVVLLSQNSHLSTGAVDLDALDLDHEDPYNKWKPDSTNEDRRRWNDVVVVGQLNHSAFTEHESFVEETRRQGHKFLREMVSTTGRTAGFGFSIVNHELRISLATPSGMFESPVIDCDEDRSAPLRLLRSLAGMTDASLGSFLELSRPVDPHHPSRFSSTSLPPLSSSFHPVFDAAFDFEPLMTSCRRNGIVGRSTNVTQVRAASTDPSMAALDCVMKSSYAEPDRSLAEEEIWTRLAELSLADAAKLPRALAFFRGPVVRGFGPYSSPNFVPRQHQVVILDEAYRSLWTVKSTKELCEGVLGAIKGHQQLYDMGYLHRDVSEGNVMLRSDGRGVLIDFDLATRLDKLHSTTTTQSRTGTITFMARGLLNPTKLPEKHAPHHDLESFLYVIFFVTLQSIPGRGRAKPNQNGSATIEKWNGLGRDPNDVFLHKVGLESTESFDYLLGYILDGWGESLIGFLRAFGEEVGLNGNWRGKEATYEALLARLEPIVQEM